MQLDDEVLFYHSQEGNSIMGKMKVTETAHQDKTTADPKWVSVTFEPIEGFDTPVFLSEIKEIVQLRNIGLIKQPRLAVMSLKIEEYNILVNKSNGIKII